MPRGLTLNQLRELREQYGSDEQIIAARPDLADTLRALAAMSADFARDAAQIKDAFRPPPVRLAGDDFDVDASIEPLVRDTSQQRQTELLAEIAAELAAQRGDAAPAGNPGRPRGSYIETETFWEVLRMALDGKSARQIDKATDIDAGHVNRVKAGVVVKWVNGNRAAAERALRGKKIPRGFLATPDGVRLPDS